LLNANRFDFFTPQSPAAFLFPLFVVREQLYCEQVAVQLQPQQVFTRLP
jgi:hypothetical protein